MNLPGGLPERRAPLLVTAELPDDVLSWADALRRAHYPPERNRLRAHVTLFHALPPSAGEEVRALLAEVAAAAAPPEARITGVMKLDHGTALAVESPATLALHAQLAERLHGLVQQKDARPLRLHVTVQNKVPRSDAAALQTKLAAGLAAGLEPRRFRFHGFGLYEWDGALWGLERVYRFRGARSAKS